MPTHKKKISPLSRRNHVLLTLATFMVGGMVSACMVMSYVFIAYPQLQSSQPAVAGAFAEQWVAPVRLSGSAASPTITAPAGILLDVETGTIVWERNRTAVRPLASLTKLITTSAYLATAPRLEAAYTIPADFHTNDITNVVEPGTGVSKLDVRVGERVTYKDLLAASIIGSANNAVLALARTAGLFAGRLQQFAVAQGARTVQVVEGSGLAAGNVGSAQDVAVLAHTAFSNPTLREFAGQTSYRVRTGSRSFVVQTTSELVHDSGYTIVAAKTGFLDEAGYNLAVQAQVDGHELLLVLLGSPTSDDRFADADALLRWGFGAHVWQVVKS
ncbi:MAG: serine hydrolase [Patescibacteria group bacterium]